MDSIFQLRRPYDFLALAQQEQRAMQVESLKRELVSQKSQIDRNEDKVSNSSFIHLGCVHCHGLCLVQGRQAQPQLFWHETEHITLSLHVQKYKAPVSCSSREHSGEYFITSCVLSLKMLMTILSFHCRTLN